MQPHSAELNNFISFKLAEQLFV